MLSWWLYTYQNALRDLKRFKRWKSYRPGEYEGVFSLKPNTTHLRRNLALLCISECAKSKPFRAPCSQCLSHIKWEDSRTILTLICTLQKRALNGSDSALITTEQGIWALQKPAWLNLGYASQLPFKDGFYAHLHNAMLLIPFQNKNR